MKYDMLIEIRDRTGAIVLVGRPTLVPGIEPSEHVMDLFAPGENPDVTQAEYQLRILAKPKADDDTPILRPTTARLDKLRPSPVMPEVPLPS